MCQALIYRTPPHYWSILSSSLALDLPFLSLFLSSSLWVDLSSQFQRLGSSPWASASSATESVQAGDRYSSAGYAALKACMITMVVTSPPT